MRILHIVPIYCDDHQIKNFHTLGGGERYPFELARFQAATNTNDDVRIMLFGKHNDSISLAGIRIDVIKGVKPFGIINKNFSPFPFSKKFFENISHADIIHGYHIKSDTTTLSSLIAKAFKKPMVLTDFGGGGRVNFSKFLKGEILADEILCISKFDSNFWKVKNKTIIYGGVDLHKYNYNARKKDFVLFVGRILPHKGLDYLIEAMPKEYKLIIAGRVFDEKYFDHLKKIANGKNIKFIRNPKDSNIITLYQNASCFVLPSTHISHNGKYNKKAELFGLVVVEAMASGTPVIVSSAASLPELIEKGNGFVFKDGDVEDLAKKISKIIKNKYVITEMGKNARKLVEEKYSWEKIALHTRAIYSELLNQN